jgi:amidase
LADIAFRSATEHLAALASGSVSASELLEHYVSRVEAIDPRVNAVVVRDLERARARARALDEARSRGEAMGPLHGLPMTVKESFHLQGTPTTFGYGAFKDNVATSNAAAVERLAAAGAVIFGKTNVPPGLMDGQSWNEVYGRTNNPWNLDRTPGGSSGGSAAALAAGLTGLEFASDIASSIRNPAHFCGVFGHKPTYGICPQRGHMLQETLGSTDIAVVGPMARSAADLELALAVVAGPDGAEAGAQTLSLPRPLPREIRDFRIALVLDDPFAEVDRTVQDQLAALGDFLALQGATVSVGARPAFDSEACHVLYMILLRAAVSARLTDEEYAAALQTSRGAGFSTRDMAKVDAFGASLSHRDWLRADEARHRRRQDWAAFFEDYDLLLCPPLSTAAFPHSQIPPQERRLVVNGREVPFENQLFWAGLAGLCYLPATVAPIGLTPDGLPVGVQIIGPQYGDLTCLRLAGLIEREYRAFEPPPGF